MNATAETPSTGGRLTRYLASAPPWLFALYGGLSSFAVYFAMFGYRKPFTAAYAQEAGWPFAFDFKIALVIAQVAGYATAKAGVLGFCQAVAVEYRAAGVRCNAVLPSVIDTPANRAAEPGADTSRWVPPEQVAAVIRFLCSDDSAPTSGAAVPVYGRA